MEAVKSHGALLEYASKELRADKEVVMTAIKNNFSSELIIRGRGSIDSKIFIFESASSDMQKNSDVLELISKKPKNILIGRADDKEFVIDKLKIQPMAFQFVSKKLQVDREVASVALDNFKAPDYKLPKLLDLFPKELMADKEFLKLITRGVPFWIDTIAQYIPKNLINDEDLMMHLFKNLEFGRIYSLPKKIENKDIIAMALKYYPSVLQLATNKIKNDKEFIMTLIAKGYPLVLSDISKKLQNDKDIVMAAVAAEPVALIHASIKMQKDSDVRDLLLDF
jgi:hypothetical protein